MPDTAPRHDASAVLLHDNALLTWLGDVATHGFGIVSGLDTTPAAAEALARRIAYPRDTIFGAMWKVASSVTDHADTSYTTAYLEPHTDSTYAHDAPGTQLFCCLERVGTGGESILVDGFALAEELRTHTPEAFDVLTRVNVPARYIEPGVHLAARRPAIRLGHDGAVEQVSFNNYDRAPFRLPPDEMAAFYAAYGALHARIVDKENWVSVRLEPGDALLFDNWRTLHGRMGYTGRRLFEGCYHNREDVESRVRVLTAT
jgi:alpha-ketoglutarate-dependent taurine dioxygenase